MEHLNQTFCEFMSRERGTLSLVVAQCAFAGTIVVILGACLGYV